jgi:hypothetical protein
MSEEVELAGGVRVVKSANPPAATAEAAAAGHDPGLAAREPSTAETAKGALT